MDTGVGPGSRPFSRRGGAGTRAGRRLRRAGAWGLACGAAACASEPAVRAPRWTGEPTTCFQVRPAYDARYAPPASLALVYGADATLQDRVTSWRRAGYAAGFMTGIAWGRYDDYLNGAWDGTPHRDDIQRNAAGRELRHGGSRPIYYLVPSDAFVRYLCDALTAAMRTDPDIVVLEEPEFWSHAGHSPAFRAAWERAYGAPWEPPHRSPQSRWRAARLMYDLYGRACSRTLEHAKSEAARRGRAVRTLVATHSLLNYATWRIVSPEASLAAIDACDGIIAQVWTGTARVKNRYAGEVRERTFETALLEYGTAAFWARLPGKTAWFLHDPIEDDPSHDWSDYESNYEHTVAASLLWPEVCRYEIMPWPNRIYQGEFPARRGEDGRIPMPDRYRAEVRAVAEALADMRERGAEPVRWHSPDPGVGLLVSDTMMFLRGEPAGSSEGMDEFFGLAMPLIKRGIRVRPVQMEFLSRPGWLEGLRVLILSYDFQLPPDAAAHDALARWVRGGGALVYVGETQRPYFGVGGWWNDEGRSARTPLGALLQALGAQEDARGAQPLGRGFFLRVAAPAARCAGSADVAEAWVGVVRKMVERTLPPSAWGEAGWFRLDRGIYTTGHVLTETGNDAPLRIEGEWIDLFSGSDRPVKNPVFEPGRSFLLKRIE